MAWIASARTFSSSGAAITGSPTRLVRMGASTKMLENGNTYQSRPLFLPCSIFGSMDAKLMSETMA
jgi:hypothetical protein